mgnify:CR=1 FL=1
MLLALLFVVILAMVHGSGCVACTSSYSVSYVTVLDKDQDFSGPVPLATIKTDLGDFRADCDTMVYYKDIKLNQRYRVVHERRYIIDMLPVDSNNNPISF